MKIVQINAVCDIGSTGDIVAGIDAVLKKSGNDSYIAAPAISDDSSEYRIRIGTSGDHKLHAVYTRLTGKQGQASRRATGRLIERLKTISPDIIHLHNIHSNYLNYPLLLRYTAEYQIPIVLTLHDCWFFTGKCNHFIDIGCDRWQTLCADCPKKRQEIPSLFCDSSRSCFLLKKQLYDMNRVYVAGVSEWITDCARRSPLFQKADVTHILNGIDIDTFHPQCGDLRKDLNIGDAFVIVSMANKWYLSQNEAAREAVLRLLGDDDRVVLVGCTEEQLSQPDDKRIVKLGYLKDKKQMAQVYATGDLFLNLTLADTLPTVNMEALACGVPVVTYASGGSGELVQDGESGYCVATGDISRLTDAINQVKSGCILPERCREIAEKLFDKKRNFTKYIQLYSKILSDGTE